MTVLNLNKTIFDGFNNTIHGAYGCFQTPSGKVNYIQVTARITSKGVSLEDELAGKLVPVREILDPKSMDFSQLLQRDLDDHRVSTSLVPYILEGSKTPAYFPPIQAILLPFQVDDEMQIPQPVKSFGSYIDTPPEQDKMGLFWKGYQYGESYRFEHLSFGDGTPVSIREGKLRWHSKRARLVVIDGQHRAMAMLAIYRTLHKAWKGPGSQYRHFYENEIDKLLKSDSSAIDLIKNGIEYPVTITWFDDNVDHHSAARKLFVDINKNAKPPTKSRLILLGESELIDIFSRTVLNNLRADSSTFPIFAVEYDYSASTNSQTGKWSALVNIEMIKSTIYRALFGPDKYHQNVDVKVSVGRDSPSQLDERFREQIEVGTWLPEFFESSSGEMFLRDSLGNDNFPKEFVEKFEERFSRSWGQVVINVLQSFLPYQSHVEALVQIKNGWVDTSDNEAALAYEAIFDGVGLYWTLKDSHEHWKENSGEGIVIPDTVKAWRYIQKKETEFYNTRAKLYLDEIPKFQMVQDLFNKTNSYACLLGLVMTVGAISKHFDIKGSSLVELGNNVIQSLNSWLNTSVDRKRRKLFICSDLKNTFNLLPKLDQNHWVYFRYFWFEVLHSAYKEDKCKLASAESAFVASSLPSMREFYFETVILPEQRKALAQVSDKEGAEFEEEVLEKSITKFNSILEYWFAESFR
ncbi:DNA sulfur modification protein DndB [Rheinheimera aquimaris]|jgi:hypothetical protein|uniref:DNA sulfur modification protein DndB n=3 Tax=Rheinheimera aquimaris TaxID=412437 RepID=UPI001E4ACD8E|nr:DNA sulfur modification protein DndB [Rheinheimera aquimaris]MCD1600033.1 hypothetical protein [Rheinheimera aquimaris]